MLREWMTTFRILLVMTLLTGVFYPLAITGLAKLVFPREANGSLIEYDGKVIGSELIGQPFSDSKYFWGRPSATTPFPYNSLASSGSNLGPINPALTDVVAANIKGFREADPGNSTPIPIDLVTSSGSGLDPDISMASALFQVERVANARGMEIEQVRQILRANFKDKEYLIIGQPRVTVLQLNLALDEAMRNRVK